MIERGANVNAPDKQGRTPLHWAAKYNCVDGVKLLLEKKADPTIVDGEGATPAQIADANGSKEVTALLQPAPVTQ
jgi:ankyrin repeat protein